MNEKMPIHHNAPRVGDQYYFPEGVAKASAYRRGNVVEYGADLLIAPETTVAVSNVNDRNITLQASEKRLKGSTNGFLAKESRLSLNDVLPSAQRIVPFSELTTTDTPRYQAWEKAHARHNKVEFVPVEVVVGQTLPERATVVDFSRTNKVEASAAD